MSNLSTASVTGASKARAKVTNSPLKAGRLGRSAAARRVRDLFQSYAAQLGHPSDVGLVAMCLAAAELTAAAERSRADYLAGRGDISVNDIVRCENLAGRALRRLGLNKPAAPPREDFQAMMLRLATPQGGSTEAHAADGADERGFHNRQPPARPRPIATHPKRHALQMAFAESRKAAGEGLVRGFRGAMIAIA